MEMRKRSALALLVLLCLLLTGCGGQDETKSEGPEATRPQPTQTPSVAATRVSLGGATLSFVPDTDFVCATREALTPLVVRGHDKEALLADWQERGVYASLIDTHGEFEVQVFSFNAEHEDFDIMTGFAEAMLIPEMKSDYVTNGFDVISCDLMHRYGHKFVRSVVSEPDADGNQWYMMDYTTCQANQYVYVCVYPYQSGPISEAIQQRIDALVDTIRISR